MVKAARIISKHYVIARVADDSQVIVIYECILL
jgi:hypothetical protein